jgi:hypothetical protein
LLPLPPPAPPGIPCRFPGRAGGERTTRSF